MWTLLSPCIGASGDMFANARSRPIRQKTPTNTITVFTPIPTPAYARDTIHPITFPDKEQKEHRPFADECRRKRGAPRRPVKRDEQLARSASSRQFPPERRSPGTRRRGGEKTRDDPN